MSNAALRTSSRLAAVQAHYELDLVGGEPAHIAAEFAAKRWHLAATSDAPGAADGAFDEAFFDAILKGSVAEQPRLDDLIRGALDKPDSFARLESLVRAILRVATYELAERPDIPVRVVINEYVELARDFFDGPQIGLINGVLDSLARSLREAEMAGRTGTGD